MEKNGTKKIYRSCQNKIIGGVCGGLGEYFEIDPIIFRLIFVILLVSAGTGLLLYIIAWIIIPLDPKCPEDDDNNKQEITEKAPKETKSDVKKRDDKSLVGLIIILVGVLFLLQNFLGIRLQAIFWPMILIAIGFALLLRSKN